MNFTCNDIHAAEYDRTGGYGYDYDDEEPAYKKCPVCGYDTEYYDFKGLFFRNDTCVGCSHCLTMTDDSGDEMIIEGRYI